MKIEFFLIRMRHGMKNKDPDGEDGNSGKSIFEIRNQNFRYIQVIVFDLSYLPVVAVGLRKSATMKKIMKNIFSFFHKFFMVAELLSPNRYY